MGIPADDLRRAFEITARPAKCISRRPTIVYRGIDGGKLLGVGGWVSSVEII